MLLALKSAICAVMFLYVRLACYCQDYKERSFEFYLYLTLNMPMSRTFTLAYLVKAGVSADDHV